MPVGTSSENGGTPQPLTLGSEGSKDFRQMCKYGKGCYQKNPMHHQKFKHPKDEESPAKGKIDTEIKEPTPKKAKLDLSPEKNVEKSELKEEKSVENEKKLEEEEVEKTEEKVEKTEEKVEEDFELIPEFDKWPLDPLESIQQKFLTKMPEDFMAFWDFCKGLNREDPSKALLDTCGLLLVGPFDILSQKTFKSCKLQDFLCHYRYYRDPPEFQTVLASADENSNFHIGYFRDDPKENPAFVAAFGGQKDSAEFSNYKLTLLGDNLFSALFLHIGVLINKVDPFKMTALQKLKGAVHLHAQMKNQDQSFTLEAKTTSMKCRDKQKVATTFHGAGLVVPYNKQTQVGYREIPESNASLKKILGKIVQAEDKSDEEKNKAFDALQELITNVQFANDEGDPGMGLELGIDVLMFGGDCLNSTAKHLLSVSYQLLNRDAFAKIAKAHIFRRKEDQICFKAQ